MNLMGDIGGGTVSTILYSLKMKLPRVSRWTTPRVLWLPSALTPATVREQTTHIGPLIPEESAWASLTEVELCPGFRCQYRSSMQQTSPQQTKVGGHASHQGQNPSVTSSEMGGGKRKGDPALSSWHQNVRPNPVPQEGQAEATFTRWETPWLLDQAHSRALVFSLGTPVLGGGRYFQHINRSTRF